MDGSAWRDVAPLLSNHGLDVFTPTLAGHGEGADPSARHVEMVQGIVDLIEDRDMADVTLLGHSFGGTIVQGVAQAVPERVRRVMFVNAFVLKDGECVNDHVSDEIREVFRDLERASCDGTISLPYPLFREIFANDATAELAREMHAELNSESAALFSERIALPTFNSLSCDRSYIHCWDDHGLPHGESTGWYPKFGKRLGLFRYASMPGGHMMLRTRPTELFEKIVEAGRD